MHTRVGAAPPDAWYMCARTPSHCFHNDKEKLDVQARSYRRILVSVTEKELLGDEMSLLDMFYKMFAIHRSCHTERLTYRRNCCWIYLTKLLTFCQQKMVYLS